MENTKRGIPRIYKGNYSKTLNFKKTISKFADERFRIYEAVFFKSSQGHKWNMDIRWRSLQLESRWKKNLN